MPTALDTLTPKQRKFVTAFLGEADRNASRAAKIAGYACAVAVSNRLLRNASIINAIRETDKKADNALILTVEQRKQKLSEIVSTGEDRDKIKAIDVLNKMEPVYINRHEMHFDGMDNEQLNTESAKVMQLDGWVCFPPDHPRVQEARELME